ncbi:hypothetical protein RB195_025893 [Necator americanus]
MLRFAVLTAAFYCASAQYGAPETQSDPAPVQYGAPAQQPPVPVILQPVYLPEVPASHEILVPRRRHRHSRSRSHSRSNSRERRCNRCRKLSSYCGFGGNQNCYRPFIEYDRDRDCERAIVTCGVQNNNVYLVADDQHTLSYGKGIEVVLKCNKRGRWTTRDMYGNDVDVRSVACYTQK